MKLVILSLALFTAPVFAATVKPTYLINSKTVSAEAALTAALNGSDVVACRPVEAKVSKAGTSIALRNKKAKSDE